MDRTERKAWEELLVHPGWDLFKGRLYTDQLQGDRVSRPCLKSQLQSKLEAAGRKGDGIECAKFAGQLEILRTIFLIPEEELKKK